MNKKFALSVGVQMLKRTVITTVIRRINARAAGSVSMVILAPRGLTILRSERR